MKDLTVKKLQDWLFKNEHWSAKICDDGNVYVVGDNMNETHSIKSLTESVLGYMERPETEPMTPEEEELMPNTPEKDMVNHPPHYQLREGYEVYDLRQDLAKKADEANVPHDQYSDWDRALEYALRCWQKNGVEDLKKARWYLDKLIGKMECFNHE